MKNLPRILIVLAFAAFIAWFFLSGTAAQFELAAIQEQANSFREFIEANYVIGVVIFMVVYILTISASLPGAAVLTLLGGFLFGFWAIIWINISSTIGAVINFFASRYVIGESVQKRFATQLKQFNKEFEENEVGYALFVRLAPVFPFFMVNFLAGLTRMKPSTFAWTTAIGTIPGTAAYVFAGRQLQEINSVSDILSTEILAVFFAFALLALIPVIFKKFQQKKAPQAS